MRIVRVRDIVEEHHRIVLGCVGTTGSKRAHTATYVLLIRFPRDVSIVQQRNQVSRCTQVIEAWRTVVKDAKIGACLQPEVVRFAWMDAWRVVVLPGI